MAFGRGSCRGVPSPLQPCGRIRVVFGAEKAAWWERAVQAWPDYAEYQQKTDRQIPVFVLTPIL
ncbi:hypothetical protein MSAR_43620 [Mycolicibacterium sarraceniae]|uniref:Nitroreductase n=1 Tax=Mycolicibacterium sarraceniae TaxID=1534348 RepID=A0A7I7SZJ3_9MYCO|nr:hypothetical protein MSAR_43620 [Mycolicibacterium sarraceniae]